MPRNPQKTHCEVPGCRAWAMRGHTRCRAHRDAELGPRSAGAPHGNLNALKHGRHAHPLPPPDLERLAGQIADCPDDLPFQLGLAAQSLQARARGDPLATLIALRSLIHQLVRAVAHRVFAAELRALLEALPPPRRCRIRETLHKYRPRDCPEMKVLLLRNLKKQLMEQNN